MSVTKFNKEHVNEPLKEIDISEMAEIRSLLLKKELVGTLDDREKVVEYRGKDFGNISIRLGGDVLITASQTMCKPVITLDDFCLIQKYDSETFTIKWCGLREPSSESPMHWTIYQTNPRTNAIIHVHILNYNPLIKYVKEFFHFRKMAITKSPSIYSNDICNEIIPMIKKGQEIIGMENHFGGFGIVSTGDSLKSAYDNLMSFYKKLEDFSRE